MEGIVSNELARVRDKIDACEEDLKKVEVGSAAWTALQQRLAAQEQRLATLEQEKLLLMQQAHGAGSVGGADASGGSAEVAKQLRESRREQRRMRRLLESQRHVLEQHLGFLSFGPTGSSHPRTSVYKPTSFNTYCGDDWEQATELRCLLTGKLYPADSVIAAHIFRHQWKDRAALIKAGIDIDGPANVIPCHKNVEKNLDLMRVTIEPTTPGQFTVKVMDPVLLQPDHQYIVDKKDGLRWSDINNKEVDFTYRDFGTEGPPLSALVCAIHMRSAIRTAENYTWKSQGSVKLPNWAQNLLNSRTGILEGYLRSAVQSAEASASDTHTSTSSPAGELQATASHSTCPAGTEAQCS